MHERITVHAAPTERAEAEFVIQTMEGLLGGHTFFSIDYGRIVAFITQKAVPTSVHHFIQLFEGHDAAVP